MDPSTTEKPLANSTEYDSILNQFTSTPEFRSASDLEKAKAIATLRDEYKSTRTVSEMAEKTIDGFSKAEADYQKSGRYRIDAETFAKTGIEYPSIDAPKEEALKQIAKFREQAEEKAIDFDPLLRDDFQFDMLREANELERQVRGKETGAGSDKAYRLAQGFVGGGLRSFGADELADEFETKFLPENPEYDENFTSKLATAGGDFVATIGIIGGATLLGGPYAGAAAGLTTNSLRKYQENYSREFAASGDHLSANDAGLAGIPGAWFETAGDMMVSGRVLKGIMPDTLRKAYMNAPTGAARSQIIKDALKDSTFRSRVLKSGAEGFVVEGGTEAGGDAITRLGGYAVTGREDFIPKPKDMAEEFLIGGILGGGFSAAGGAVRRFDPILQNKENVSKLQEFITNNDEAGLQDFFQSKMITPLPEVTAPKPVAPKSEKVTKPDGTTTNEIKVDDRVIEVDENTAKAHDLLIDRLTALSRVDTLDDLEPGNRKGQRNSPPTNNKRAQEQVGAATVDSEIDALIPSRAEQFKQIDATAAAAKIDPKQVDFFKRTIDAAAITAIQNGIDPNIVYRPKFQSESVQPEQQLNIKSSVSEVDSRAQEDAAYFSANEWDMANRGSRSDEWFFGGNADEDAVNGYNESLSLGGSGLQAHGMSKEATLSGGIRNLANLLRNGLDPSRGGGRLDTAPLVSNPGEGLIGATASGAAYKDGPFTLVAKKGMSLSGDLSGLGAVIINQANAEQAPLIKEMINGIRPDVIVGTASELGFITKQLLSPATTETKSSDAINDIINMIDSVVSPEAREDARKKREAKSDPQLNIELNEKFEAPAPSELEESLTARRVDESANPEFDIDDRNGEITVSSTEFNPPTTPTLIDGRQIEDGDASDNRSKGIYNYEEGKITDIGKRTKAFNKVGYSQKNIPSFKSNDAAIEFSKKFKKQISKARSFFSFDSLGMHHNGGILINQSVLSNSDSIETARVLAHELGHAAHSLLGDEINSDQDIKNELIAIEEYLYSGLREAVSNTENADNRFYNYLLSPNELIAEFNVLRLSDPDTSVKIAPRLQEKLESVDNADNLVVDRKTYPLGIGRVYSKAGPPITTTDKGVKSRSKDSSGYAGNILFGSKHRAKFLKEAKEGSIISALSAARWFPKEIQKLIDDGVFDNNFWKDRLQNTVDSIGPQGTLYQADNSTLSQQSTTELLDAATDSFGESIGNNNNPQTEEAKVLNKSARLQRGYPESYARADANLKKDGFFEYHSGVRSSIHEHIGDLYHRAASNQLTAILEKVKTWADNFNGPNRIPINEDLSEQLESNAVLRFAESIGDRQGKDEAGYTWFNRVKSHPDFPAFLELAREKSRLADLTYAAMYSRLQAFTPIQAMGRNMAIAFGIGDFKSYNKLANQIRVAVGSVDSFTDNFDISGVNNHTRTNNATKSQFDLTLQLFDKYKNSNVDELREANDKIEQSIKSGLSSLTDISKSANLNTSLNQSILQQSDQLNIKSQESEQPIPIEGEPYLGNFFHGGSFDGNGKFNPSKEGSLGAGYYLTTEDRAAEYAKESGSTLQAIENGTVNKFGILLDKPLVINMDEGSNFVEGLIFEKLGMNRDKAFEKADKIIEEKGYIGKQFQSTGRKLGYDGIIQIRNGKVAEIVAWDSDSLTEPYNSILSQGQDARGTIEFENADGTRAPLEVPITELNDKINATIKIMEEGGNISTFHHEMMHWYHRAGIFTELLTPEQLTAFESAANLKDGVWREENYETVARAYEAWLRNPLKRFDSHIKVPAILDKAFRKISSAFQNLYRSLRDSPLPSAQSAKGITVPSIHPDFRVAFEALYNFDTTAQLNVKSPDQNATQLAPVNSQLTQRGQAVSPPQVTPEATEVQLTKEEQEAKDLEEKENRLNIKLVSTLKPETQLDREAQKNFKDVLTFKTALESNPDLSGLFYAVLENFARSRRLSKHQGTPPEIRRPSSAFAGEDFLVVKDFDSPRYTQSINNILRKIHDEAFKLWFDDYASKHSELEGKDISEFGSKIEVLEFVKINKEKKADENPDENLNRAAINDNIIELQTVLRSRDMSELPMPTAGPLRKATEGLVEFLRSYDVTNEETSDADAMRIQFMLDSMLNDDTVVGLEDFAKHMQTAYAGKLNGKQKFRAAYSKFGLIGVLNNWFGVDVSSSYSNLALVSTNLEKVAGNTEALTWLQDFVAPYYQASTEAKAKKREFREFLKANRKKWTNDKTNHKEFQTYNGIISKLIQVPLDLDADGRNNALATNIEQFTIGVNNMIDQGGNVGKSGLTTKSILDKVLADAPLEHEQFVNHVSERFPSNFGWITDAADWVADNITEDAKFVSEALYKTPFNRHMYYLPTMMINLVNPELDVHAYDESHMVEGNGDSDFIHRSPIHVSRTGSLKSRLGYIPNGESDPNRGKYAYATNLETVMLKGVDGVIHDIYTGFDRKILAAVNPSAGGIYDMLGEAMGGGKTIVNHLRKTLSDMVNTDLNQHRYVNQTEALAASFRRNIAPAMLSSIHQIISQPVSQMIAWGAKRPEMLPYLKKALSMNLHTKVDNDVNGFRAVMDRTLAERALPHDPLLTKGESAERTTQLDDLILSHVVNEAEKWTEFKNKAHLLHEFTKDKLLWGLRTGDTFSADLIFAAELIAAGAKEQGVTDPMLIDYNAISPEAIHRSVIAMDEAINASINSRRGNYLAHPSAVMSLLTIFAGHRISIATTFGTKFRNAVEFLSNGQYDDPMLKESLKYMVATVGQSVAFTSVKFLMMAPIVKGIYQALTPDEDDERHWLYGELEKSQVEKIRKTADDAVQRGFGDGVLSANILRDIFGNVVAISAFGGLDNVVFTLGDKFRKPEFEIAKAEAIEQIEKQVAERARYLTPVQLQDFRNQIEAIEKIKFAPMGFQNFGADDLSGGLGAAMGPPMDFVGALTDIPNETKNFTFEEFVLFMRTFGIGQPELTRALKFGAKIKDELQADEVKSELGEFDF
jgi:hypothetical protein